MNKNSFYLEKRKAHEIEGSLQWTTFLTHPTGMLMKLSIVQDRRSTLTRNSLLVLLQTMHPMENSGLRQTGICQWKTV